MRIVSRQRHTQQFARYERKCSIPCRYPDYDDDDNSWGNKKHGKRETWIFVIFTHREQHPRTSSIFRLLRNFSRETAFVLASLLRFSPQLYFSPILFLVFYLFFGILTMNLDFNWIGDPISVDFEDKQLTNKPKTFYQ